MAKRASGGRGRVSGKGSVKRASKRTRGKSLSAAIPADFERVESVIERATMEHGPMTRGLDARFLSLPALNIISLLGFAIIAAYQVTTFKYDVQSQLGDMGKQITQLSVQVKEMSTDTDAKAKRRWSRNDMIMWCKDTEDTNRDEKTGKKGFTCGAIGPMSIDGAAQ